MMTPINWSPGPGQLRSFGRIWWPLFVITVSVVSYRRFGKTMPVIIGVTAGALAAIATASSAAAARVLFLALQVATYPLAFVTSSLVLGAIYFLVVTPIGLALRWAGRDALGERRRQEVSLWGPPREESDPEEMFRQF
jgi:hypothetical protein